MARRMVGHLGGSVAGHHCFLRGSRRGAIRLTRGGGPDRGDGAGQERCIANARLFPSAGTVLPTAQTSVAEPDTAAMPRRVVEPAGPVGTVVSCAHDVPSQCSPVPGPPGPPAAHTLVDELAVTDAIPPLPIF